MGNKQSSGEPKPVHSDGATSTKHKKKQLECVSTGETFGADEALKEQVTRKLKEKIRTKIHHLIVFCPITSRVGSDVEAAMDKMKNDQGIILVLMHHTRDPDYSTAGTNWSEKIENVKLDVHVLFHESVPGLLKCSQNHNAVDQIVEFLKQKKKRVGKTSQSKTEEMKDKSKLKNNSKKRDQTTEKTRFPWGSRSKKKL